MQVTGPERDPGEDLQEGREAEAGVEEVLLYLLLRRRLSRL
jgi:hypothetical protein